MNTEKLSSLKRIFILSLMTFLFTSAIPEPAFPVDDSNTVIQVMCNIITFTKQLGMPIITGVILGSSIMAIFGKFGWGAIVMLVVFTAVFFGSEQLIGIFVKGIAGGDSSFSCASYGTGTGTGG